MKRITPELRHIQGALDTISIDCKAIYKKIEEYQDNGHHHLAGLLLDEVRELWACQSKIREATNHIQHLFGYPNCAIFDIDEYLTQKQWPDLKKARQRKEKENNAKKNTRVDAPTPNAKQNQ